MSSLVNRIAPLLRPVIALNLWTFTMEVWMYATRIPAMNRLGIKPSPTITAAKMNAVLPPDVIWKADNYNNLMQQPQQFYGVMGVLVAMELAGMGVGAGSGGIAGDGVTVNLAWAYVGLRVVHGLVHASVNNVRVRFTLFAASSMVLLGMTFRAAFVVF